MHAQTFAPAPAADAPRATAALTPAPFAPLRRAALGLGLALGLGAALLAPAAQAETEVQVITSPGGITAWLVEEHAIPMVAMEFIFDTGARLDPMDQQGATNFLSTMLDEGAGDLDSAAFSARAETLALRVGFDAGRDSFTVNARMLTENLGPSAELLRLALVEPRFDAEPLERMRAGILSGLRSEKTDPDAIAAEAWRDAVYGPGSVHGRPMKGTEADVEAITADTLRAARARAFNRSGVAVGVVGDIDAETLGPLLDRILGDLPDAPLPAPELEMVETDGALQVVEFDTPQAVARLVGPGILRDDPDFMAAYVMNHVLGGGGFASRLMEEVREKRGLTYGVWSYLAAGQTTGLVVAGVSSDNAKVAEAVEVIKAEWARMAAEGPTAEELEAAKQYLTGAYPLRFDSNGKIAGQLAGLMHQGFTPDYIRDRNAMIEAVTLEDAKAAAARLLDAGKLHVTVVGKPEGLGDAVN
ncbi:M16 family metallopeptidase [Rhodovulum sp. DZ06]|uniref:M16 family metallopeptidase n=1 Tax=Rhodovulum sp. DZ06 TaxID=3425126 RepID=UPI003D32A969